MKYGVPHYDSDGRLTGVSFDNDGDGVFDDYQHVNNTIEEENDASIISADIDGDGVYDDTIYVSHARRYYDSSTPIPKAREKVESFSHSSYYVGKGVLSGKTKLKIFLIIVLALLGLSLLTWGKSLIMVLLYYNR